MNDILPLHELYMYVYISNAPRYVNIPLLHYSSTPHKSALLSSMRTCLLLLASSRQLEIIRCVVVTTPHIFCCVCVVFVPT